MQWLQKLINSTLLILPPQWRQIKAGSNTKQKRQLYRLIRRSHIVNRGNQIFKQGKCNKPKIFIWGLSSKSGKVLPCCSCLKLIKKIKQVSKVKQLLDTITENKEIIRAGFHKSCMYTHKSS